MSAHAHPTAARAKDRHVAAESRDSGGLRRIVRALAPYLWPVGRGDLKARVVGAVLLVVAAKVVLVTVPFFYKAAVDALDGKAQAAAVPLALIVAYGVARVLSQGLGELRDALFARVSQHATRAVGLKTFEHLHGLSLAFHLGRRTGGVSRAIERGTKGVEFLLRLTLFNIAPTLLEILFVTGVLYVKFGWTFAAVVLAAVLGYVAFTFGVSEWRTRVRREMNRADSEANTRAIDSLLNFETVKYFGNERHEARRFDASLARYHEAAEKSQITLSVLNAGQGLVISVALVVLMLMAANGVVAGRMTLGDFVLVNTFMIQLYQPLNFLGVVYREIRQALVDMEVMFDLLDVAPDVKDAPDARPLAVSEGRIAFERVNFAYEAARPILDDLSFEAAPGSTIAIVGPSGAGKSTISRLLFRFYDVQGGRVTIDGQDVRSLTQASLRAAIGIVPQDTVLFNDTIRYNIRYGRPGASDEEIEQAARHAQIDRFIASLPDGYDSMVGERGLKLSGGEKQRVAIARTILKDPKLLVLDEATSALDTHTEREIQGALAEVSRGRTTLIIAHRLSTVVDADQILVLVDGAIAERGRHDELLRAGGVYAGMWSRQQEAAEAAMKLRALEG